MGKYVLKRFGLMIVTLWVVATITFFLMHALPGDPLTTDKGLTPEARANLEEKYGLNKPLISQYGIYMNNLLHGDLGISLRYKTRTVNSMLMNGLPASAKVGFLGSIIGISIGIVMGIIAALNNKKFLDYFVIFIVVLGVSVPGFVFASVYQYFFGVKLRVLPVAGWEGIKYMILPIASLATFFIATFARFTKTSMLEIMGSDYIETAKSKGLSNTTVIFKHVLRNASIPIITFLGPSLATSVVGSFVIESIFGVPGIGQFFVTSVQQYDYTMILGTTLFTSALVIVGYFISDMLYGVADPRIRIDK
ncbi:ABC transporter permease [Sporosalibacterium faouarense]|uniref:ABC transporter permease n=1 Tax=Sporosalibacterium faouarense TaxID=516123 RepID=UPI00141CFF97|nr:ABC transporter permease [Sporosalibacterium faouarense]MTI46699.1 ABC transporter permease [Bacillota bacterium]